MSPDTLLSMPDSYLMRDLLLLPFALLAVWFLNAKLLKRPYRYSWDGIKPLLQQTGFGVLFAFAAVLLCILPGLLLGAFNPAGAGFEPFQPRLNLTGLPAFTYLVELLAFQSLWEEMLFRSLGLGLLACLFFWLCNFLELVPYKGLAEHRHQEALWFYCGTTANLTIAIAFAFAHSNNAFVTWVGLGNVMLAGMVIGQLFILHRSLGSAWGFHFGWNFLLAFLGLPVSGFSLVPPVVVGFLGSVDGILSGGAFGPEGALPTTLILATALVFLLRQCWQNAHIQDQPSALEDSRTEASVD